VPKRRKPYTVLGILRKKCVRCGAQATEQWAVCADDNEWRPICVPCDVAMNELVLTFIRDPEVAEKMARYRARKLPT
jgi:hypothetical protein